ncbi:MAG: flagellar biosynthesis protein FlhB [Rhodobacteraceae bacterium]|uniref:flagellar type III secretion system protein FlhB n=1 Tax=Albidovulum sp. TaxID=1872424 RepID=UPI001D5219CC|nr:flagellar type III secretion system protein FlhB [uncultured Defluviimonas sp.]MCB2124422.1 flagellar biosynthesis protein FlhB [Paracoccaceae bacterium]MCC0070591.1 flagellar biosynthesis protein FlhB [Paracoccaceae bacterium]
MSTDDSGEKEHEPTPKRLDEARKRGEVVRSAEISLAAAYGGLLVAAIVTGASALRGFGDAGVALLARAEETSALVLHGGNTGTGKVMAAMLTPVLPFFIFPAVAVLVSLLAQRSIVATPERLMPRLDRIDPIANARRKFGREGLFEFAKSAVKLCLVSGLLGWFLAQHLPGALRAQGHDAGPVAAELARLILEFLLLVLALSAVTGAIDYLWQRQQHLRRNRMSRQELMEEFKEAEGDPHVKGQRRQRAEAVATSRMLADVPKADVVIVNPTHYAVALRWDRASRRAPVCVAKGVDEVAARIREAAATAGVPIRSDPPTARAIHATVQVGQEILRDHYAPVAAAIRFAEAMRRRAGAGRAR